jgi:PAS domain S-box-containing protein
LVSSRTCTEHKLAEDALRDSEAKLRTLFNHSPDLIFTVDGDANILLTNRPLPYPVGGAGEKRSELILPPDVRGDYLHKLRQVFESGRIEHFQYGRVMPRGGKSAWCRSVRRRR